MLAKYTSKSPKFRQFLAFLATLFVFLPFAAFSPAVLAATAPWSAQETIRSHQSISLQPGAAMTFEIKFKNTGTKTWTNSGANFVALATVEPEKHPSKLRHAFWEEAYRPARLLEASVKPGAVGTFRFALQAPKTEGAYKETVQAVAKNLAWIEGTKITFTVNVSKTTAIAPPASSTPKPTTTSTVSPSQSDYPVRDSKAYAVSWVTNQVYQTSAVVGETIEVTVQAKNEGNTAWHSRGSRFTSLYTVRPNDHASLFYAQGAKGWLNDHQVSLDTATVSPGATGTLTFTLQAPTKPGEYRENFRLASEEYSWLKNGEMQLVVIVVGLDSIPAQPGVTNGDGTSSSDPSSTSALYRDTTYDASYLVSSHRKLDLKPGEKVTVQFGYKNTGQKVWKREGTRFVSLYTIEPNYRSSRFAVTSSSSTGWLSDHQVLMTESEVAPGQIGYFKFDIVAPSITGTYVEKFRLAAEDLTWVKGGELELPILVRLPDGGLPSTDHPGDTGAPNELGPIMRVGLYASDDPFIMTADSPFEVHSGSGETLVSLPARSPVTVTYDRNAKTYGITALGLERVQTDYVILQALDNFTIMTILSLNKPVPWNPAVNENTFRGSIEIRHSDVTNKTWAINVLPMEHYLRGIAETSSNSEVEFLKVMTLAARTYGYYHFQRQTKHADENFFVDSVYDQVYRGYSLEQRHPSLKQAVLETAGEVVTYTVPETGEIKIAITPYFSQSDGRTRSWSEVWGGDVAWTKSVPVPRDQGKTLLGHGVGLSARGGLLMIEEEGKSYKDVLHYFFQNIVIQDWY